MNGYFGFNIWRAIPKDSYSKVNEPAYTYSAQVESVIDGDTIWTIIDLGFGTLSRQKLRLNYIDTPELGTAPGEKASRYVRRILKANPNIVICTHKHDKYTRYLGACRRTRSGFERLISRLPASGCIDDKTNIACFAVFVRRKNCSLSGRRRSFPTEPTQIMPFEQIVLVKAGWNHCKSAIFLGPCMK